MERCEVQSSGCKSAESPCAMGQPSWDTTCTSPRASLLQQDLDPPQHSERGPWTVPTPWPSPFPKPPAQPRVRSLGVTRCPKEICQTASAWGPASPPVHPPHLLTCCCEGWAMEVAAMAKSTGQISSVGAKGPAEPQPGLYMCILGSRKANSATYRGYLTALARSDFTVLQGYVGNIPLSLEVREN